MLCPYYNSARFLIDIPKPRLQAITLCRNKSSAAFASTFGIETQVRAFAKGRWSQGSRTAQGRAALCISVSALGVWKAESMSSG